MSPTVNKYLAEATKLGDEILTFAQQDLENLISNPLIRMGVNFGINAALSFLHAQEVSANVAASVQTHSGVATTDAVAASIAAHVAVPASPAVTSLVSSLKALVGKVTSTTDKVTSTTGKPATGNESTAS